MARLTLHLEELVLPEGDDLQLERPKMAGYSCAYRLPGEGIGWVVNALRRKLTAIVKCMPPQIALSASSDIQVVCKSLKQRMFIAPCLVRISNQAASLKRMTRYLSMFHGLHVTAGAAASQQGVGEDKTT